MERTRPVQKTTRNKIKEPKGSFSFVLPAALQNYNHANEVKPELAPEFSLFAFPAHDFILLFASKVSVLYVNKYTQKYRPLQHISGLIGGLFQPGENKNDTSFQMQRFLDRMGEGRYIRDFEKIPGFKRGL